MSDLVTFGETMLRLSPPTGERLEQASRFDVHAAGAESNTAVAAERLGAVSTWISKLPDSPLGRRVVNELRGYGIDVDVVWDDDGRQGTYYLEHAGEPRGTNVIYDRTDAAVTTATAEELPAAHIRDARLFYTSGITPALSNTLRETTATLLRAAGEAGTRTALDVNYREKLWTPAEARKTLLRLFEYLDVLFLATKDARRVLDYEGEPRQLAHSLANEYDIETVVVTQGEHGALAISDGVLHEQGVFSAETLDPIGTGDAFVGAFLARRLSGDGVERALEMAAATASLKRTIGGDVATVTQAEVEAVVRDGERGVRR